MSRPLLHAVVVVCFLSGFSRSAIAYEDDDLLCRPGWSPELYQQQIWQQNYEHRMSIVQQQQAMIKGAVDARN